MTKGKAQCCFERMNHISRLFLEIASGEYSEKGIQKRLEAAEEQLGHIQGMVMEARQEGDWQ